MAHKKGASSSSNGRDSESKRLGVKRFGGQQVNAEQLLQHWLAHGPVAANEQPLLQRVAALF